VNIDTQNSPVFFGEWVKQRRKALVLTQEELAQRAGCSKFAMRKIESGERRPSKQLAELLAKALELSPDEHQTFIRVARGEINLERLHLPSLESALASISDTLTKPSASLQTASASSRIPLQPTQLIGRESELAAMERLFKDPQCRLLTLTGMGGIGKTRLAIEFATRQLPEFPGGIYYVPLASIQSAEAIVPGIATTLGLIFSGTIDPREELIGYFASQISQSLLLVLDNLEHLLAQPPLDEKNGVVNLVSEFLHRLPNMKILTTSRERLNLHGEWMYEMHGLTIPPPEIPGSLEDYSATMLFIQSARRARADFEVTDKEQSAIIQICNLLGGVPLAIELAAAWVEMLSCQEIVMEIQSNIDFLATSMRDIPERHRSLKATFDHSWKLLSVEERDALCRLSVFHGGFDRNAAAMIAGAILPLLASLVSKSLVRRVEDKRYDLHEVIRQYASSHYDETPSQCFATCGFHSDYYLNFVSGYEKSLKSASQQDAMWEISAELDNIRAAWGWAIKQRNYEMLRQAVRSIGWYFEVAGLLNEGIEQLEPLAQILLTEPRNRESNKLLGLVYLHQGLLYFRRGQFVRAQELYQNSVAILRPTGDQALLADALIFLGTITHLIGEYAQSKELLQEGLEYALASNSRWFEAYGIYNLGYVDSLMGDSQKGYEQMLVGVEMWRDLGDPHYIALGLNFMVSTLIKLGRYAEAKTYMWESIELCEKNKNRWGMGTAYRYLGLAYLAEGQYDKAQENFQISLDIFGEYTEGWDIALSLSYLGEAAIAEGNLTEARRNFLKALQISIDSHSIPIALDSLLGLGHFYAQTGMPEHAFELSHFVLNHPFITQETRTRAKEISSEARNLLTDNQIKVIEQEALSLTFEEIVRQFTSLAIEKSHAIKSN
jgi:predicted ATPase/DNA-binding XRE family transcriptional regulator